METQKFFSNIPDKDFLGLFDHAVPKAKRIADLLNLSPVEVGKATDAQGTPRLEPERIPKEVQERIAQWGTALNLVASFFGDELKTIMWFSTPNPMLGDVAPRDMIRMGRFKKLLSFIQNALNETQPA